MAGITEQTRNPCELDPRLAATPFGVETSWHVLTGAPSCGKTTLIDLLASEGYLTVAEGARRFMEQEMAGGRSITEIHDHGAALQRQLLHVQLGLEADLRPTDVVFLDGATPQSLAWFRLFGLNPNEALPHCFRYRYASVFVLDPLPLDLDGIRFDDNAHIGFLDQWIERDFTTLGYRVIRVPVMSPNDRLRFVLSHVPQDDRKRQQGLVA